MATCKRVLGVHACECGSKNVSGTGIESTISSNANDKSLIMKPREKRSWCKTTMTLALLKTASTVLKEIEMLEC